jgi:NitT/TauT family transport system substrate-binding protein
MGNVKSLGFSRRTFLTSASAMGAAAFLGVSRSRAAEPPPETTKVRLAPAPNICTAPASLAEALLRLEGFTEVEYVDALTEPGPDIVAAGRADFTQWGVFAMIPMLDAGAPIRILSGVLAGCQELFANDQVRAVRDPRSGSPCPRWVTRTTSPFRASWPTSGSISGRNLDHGPGSMPL